MSSSSNRANDFQKSLIDCEAPRLSPTITKNCPHKRDSQASICVCRECIFVPSPMPDPGTPRHHLWQPSPYYRSHMVNTRRKLLLLIGVASLALLSIVVISHQLISRHATRTQNTLSADILLAARSENFIHELDVITLDDWIQQEDFGENNLRDRQFSKIKENSKLDAPTASSLIHVDGTVLVEDGIFWSQEIEAKISPGLSDQEVESQLQELRQRKVVGMELPDWLHCGREKNRYVLFEDGSNACARYRSSHAEFVQGEVMAFYLARLLGISNTPVVALSKADSHQWAAMQGSANSQWPREAIVALIEWLPDLTKTTMPRVLREFVVDDVSGAPPLKPLDITSVSELSGLDDSELGQMVQWSDLIIFDYLTGNYDRVASMQDGAEKENRVAILKETVHNLALSTQTGSIWLLDNESAFLDAYSLLYAGDENGKRFLRFHEVMLRTMCIFRRKTIDRLFALRRDADPANLLINFISNNEPLFSELPKIYHNSVFMQHFQERLDQVWQWVKQCQLHTDY